MRCSRPYTPSRGLQVGPKPAFPLRNTRPVQKPPQSSVVEGNKAPIKLEYPYRDGPIIIDGQVAHSMTEERFEIINGMDSYLRKEVLKFLKPIQKIWQPSDLLPLAQSESFFEEVKELRQKAECLPLDYLVVLVGDMITEEALPTYMAMLNTLDGVRDETGAQKSAWATWTRQWVAEENRHGDLLNRYLYLSGRVDLRKIEVTIQNLITAGMDPRTENNPYLGFIYTSFQERATRITHGNTAAMALKYGDDTLAKICGTIASDESRHELAYKKVVEELFRVDPNGAILAFNDMMKKQIVMPAHLMDDGEHSELNEGRNLFSDYADVAQRMELYTMKDYCEIIEHLIARWDVSNVKGLSADGLEAQEKLCTLPGKLLRLAERMEARKKKGPPVESKFSWIFNQSVVLSGDD